MRTTSVVAKLWLAFTALILVVLVPLEFALNRVLTDFYTQQVTEPLLYHSQQFALLLAHDPAAIQQAAMIGRMVGGEVAVLDRDGALVSVPGSSQVAPPPSVAREVLAGNAVVAQASFAGRGQFIVTAVPVPDRGGAVVLMSPAEPVQHARQLAVRYLWAAGGGTLLLGTALAFFLSRQLLRPVIAIERATRTIAQGDFTTQVDVHSRDEIGHLAESVNQMTTQLKGYEDRRREFLANVAHELRTPLAYIRGYTQALAEGLISTPEERQRYQRIVQEEAVRVGRLVDDLMDLAQMEEGQMAFDRAPLDLRVPIELAVATIRPAAEEKGVQVEASLPAMLPLTVADGGRIQQVLLSLLDNALRYTPKGGRISVSAMPADGWITVRVTDTGAGIDPDYLPLIFERFHKRESSGRGLGLAIVRSIVRAHSGDVGVQSEPGRGTTFWFRLPTMQS